MVVDKFGRVSTPRQKGESEKDFLAEIRSELNHRIAVSDKYLDLKLSELSSRVYDSAKKDVSSTKLYLDSLSSEIKNINVISSNKVDRNYLNERLQIVLNRISELVVKDKNKVDKIYLDTILEQIGVDIKLIKAENSLNKQYLDTKLHDFEKFIAGQPKIFEDRLLTMTNSIKANILEEFVSKDLLKLEMSKLGERVNTSFTLKSQLNNEIAKLETKVQNLISTEKLEDRVKLFKNEIMKPITENQTLTDSKLNKLNLVDKTFFENRLKELSTAVFSDERFHRNVHDMLTSYGYSLIRRYLEEVNKYDWEAARKQGLDYSQMVEQLLTRMGYKTVDSRGGTGST